jgi:hypothetical protein
MYAFFLKMPIIIPTKQHAIRSYFLPSILMKRVASIILLSLFLYTSIGYYFAFSILNWQNNTQMSLVIKKSNSFETLRIHKSELKNIVFKNNGKEILYSGDMYDVKNKAMDGDYSVFYCKKDNKEKKLLANLNDHIHNNIDTKSSSEKNHPEKSGQKNILKDYLLHKKGMTYYTFSNEVIFNLPNTLNSLFIEPLSTPPPKFSFS